MRARIGLVAAAALAALAAAEELGQVVDVSSSSDLAECGWQKEAGQNATYLWNLVVPSYLGTQPQDGMIGLHTYDEAAPRSLLNHLHSVNTTAACSENYGISFPRGGSSWARLTSCLEEHEALDYTVVNTDLTVADCKAMCPDAPDGPLPYNFCALLGGDARPLSAPLPQFLLMKSGRPVQRLYQRLSADGLRAATFGARGSPLPPRSGPERACSVEAISAALFLADNAQLHECSVKEHLGDRFVKFAAGAASGSIESNFNDRIAALGVVVVGGGLCVAVLAALNTFAHDYPATVSLAVNVVSSVAIIFVNKTIYLRGFNYVITLGGIHFLATSSVRLCAQKQSPKDGDISYRDLALFTLLNTGSLSTSNLSLFFNSVGFYQISKLMLMPMTCLLEFIFLGFRPTPQIVASVTVVLVGVGITTVTNVSVNPVGLAFALVQVVLAAAMQVHIFILQQKYNMRPETFIAQTAWLQGAVLLTLGPAADRLLQGSWVFGVFFKEDPTLPGTVFYLALSSAVAVAVNVSQAAAIGAASALAFQVLGHAKTILVLVIAFVFFDSHWTPRSLGGAALAFCGIVAYGVYRHQAARQAAQGRGAALRTQQQREKEEGAGKGGGGGEGGGGGGRDRGAESSGGGAAPGGQDAAQHRGGAMGGADATVVALSSPTYSGGLAGAGVGPGGGGGAGAALLSPR